MTSLRIEMRFGLHLLEELCGGSGFASCFGGVALLAKKFGEDGVRLGTQGDQAEFFALQNAGAKNVLNFGVIFRLQIGSGKPQGRLLSEKFGAGFLFIVLL